MTHLMARADHQDQILGRLVCAAEGRPFVPAEFIFPAHQYPLPNYVIRAGPPAAKKGKTPEVLPETDDEGNGDGRGDDDGSGEEDLASGEEDEGSVAEDVAMGDDDEGSGRAQ